MKFYKLNENISKNHFAKSFSEYRLLFIIKMQKEDFKESRQRLMKMDMDFGIHSFHSMTNAFHLQLHNPTNIAAKWRLFCPFISNSVIELWDEPLNPDPSQKRMEFILNNQIFTINPPNGTLDPGARQTVTIQYHPISNGRLLIHLFDLLLLGLHELPMIFEVYYGSQMIWNLKAETTHSRVVRVEPMEWELQSMPLGSESVPQTFLLYNSGTCDVHLEWDLSVFDQHQSDNYDFPVFQFFGNSQSGLLRSKFQFYNSCSCGETRIMFSCHNGVQTFREKTIQIRNPRESKQQKSYIYDSSSRI